MRLLVLEGDGIGPEIVEATMRVMRRADSVFGLDLSVQSLPIGFTALKASGTTFPVRDPGGGEIGRRHHPRADPAQ